MCIMSPFSPFCISHRDSNGIVFKNLYFETHFQKFALSGPQTAIIMYMNGQNMNVCFFLLVKTVLRKQQFS